MLSAPDAALLEQVRDALRRRPFADPVLIVDGRGARKISRRDARAMERLLLRLGRVV